MRAILASLLLLSAAALSPSRAAAQGHAGHDMGAMKPADLAAHCAQMKRDGNHADTPDMRRMMAQCDELDHSATAASRRR